MFSFFNKIIALSVIGTLIVTSSPLFSGTTDSSQISAPDVKAMQLKANVDTTPSKLFPTDRNKPAEGAGDQVLKPCPEGYVLVQIQNTDQEVYFGENPSYCMESERYCAGSGCSCPGQPVNCCKFAWCHIRTRCKTWSPTQWTERSKIPPGTLMNQPSVLSQGVCAPVSNTWQQKPTP